MTIQSPKSKRGVLLILILSLLAMFGLVAFTFVLVSGHSLRSSRATQRMGQFVQDPKQVLHEALMKFVAGSEGGASRIGPHSLLEDLYGDNTSPEFQIGTATPIAGGALIHVTVSGLGNAETRGGCVLTVLSGPAAGLSTHIVGVSDMNTGGGTAALILRAFDDLNLDYLGSTINTVLTGQRAIVNGHPFSGKGFTFNEYLNPGIANGNGANQANEDYDAVDPQNMFLAAMIDSPLGSGSDGLGPFSAGSQIQQSSFAYASFYSGGSGYQANLTTIPSFHRPALVQYQIAQNGGGDWQDQDKLDIIQKVILRPLRLIHPEFTGSNPGFNPIMGPWDVDNDGDGLADSIWIDAGLTISSTSDGRLYKPLIAVMCLDLDGRANLNVHGSLGQLNSNFYNEPTTTSQGVSGARIANGTSTGTTVLDAYNSLPTTALGGMRGQGWGPAEINLDPMFVSNPDQFAYLLQGNGSSPGRYGQDQLPGYGATPDYLGANMDFLFGRPTDNVNYWSFISSPGSYINNSYGNPADPHGYGAVCLDMSGRPLYLDFTNPTGSTSINDNDPYEIQLYDVNSLRAETTAADTPFTPEELERLLRPFDRDSVGLPDRLVELTKNTTTGLSSLHRQRHSITTESYDIPCMPSPIALEFQGMSATQMINLIAPEMLAGRKMNLNRPFGDGVDSDGDGIVDEPDEAASEYIDFYTSPGNIVKADQLDQANADAAPSAAAAQYARAEYARHLYVIAKLKIETQTLIDAGLCKDATEANRLLAQWAVNVVDFRDRDNIMTRFQYDVNPLDGWDATNGPVVYGCERPELLLTETLAFHDRRTEDLEKHGWFHRQHAEDALTETEKLLPEDEKEALIQKRLEAQEGEDGEINGDLEPDMDQRFRPQGSLFVEIFNPWTAGQPKSCDLYDSVNGNLVLSKTTSANGGSPVWRLAIADVSQTTSDDGSIPDPDRYYLQGSGPQVQMERVVYFAPKNSVTTPVPSDRDGWLHYYPSQQRNVVVEPGGYALVGPGKSSGTTAGSRTNVGLVAEAAGNPGAITDANLRHIELDPTKRSAGSNKFAVQNTSTVTGKPASSNIRESSWVAIDEAYVNGSTQEDVRMSISEPFSSNGASDNKPYDLLARTTVPGQPEVANNYKPDDEQYENTCDMPLDRLRFGTGAGSGEWTTLYGINTTVSGYRVVYLQRLADPTMPYDVNTNPYLTVDTMPVDLTTFNGVSKDSELPSDTIDDLTNEPNFRLASRQRGEIEDELRNDPKTANVWKQEVRVRRDTCKNPPGGTAATGLITEELSESLGFINYDYFGAPNGTSPYIGDPSGDTIPRMMPWLTWLNRPFVSPMELALVPTLSSSRLLSRPDPEGGIKKYFDYVDLNTSYNDYSDPLSSGFPHLLNFFSSDKENGSGLNANLLFDYVTVPTPFASAYEHVSAEKLTTDSGHKYNAPNHLIPLYREPGKINVNTIFNKNVFECLVGGFPYAKNTTADEYWSRFVTSRRGYASTGAGGPEILEMDPNCPTRFGNPFRTPTGALDAVAIPGTTNQTSPPIQHTTLRADPAYTSQPLLGYQLATPTGVSKFDAVDANRNPYFRIQGAQRLQNLITTRSNVFAVWITVGYFEVKPATTAIPNYKPEYYPDGYQLGAELGSETGDIQRHRAFYIIDRSIPVGFQRGNGLNVDRAILVKRYIE